MNLRDEIEQSLDKCSDEDTRVQFTERLTEDKLLRDDGVDSHFCVYFVPYNPQDKTILVGDHKKSGLWLIPGGHVDPGEALIDTLNREIEEELGVKNFYEIKPEPFLLSIANIERDSKTCKKHFDIWHLMKTDGADFDIDYTEYNEVRWVTVSEARKLVTDPANLVALNIIETL